MVSKVAVIALVAIVACPILLGYAMNLNEVTETDYREYGESVNITPLLQNDVGYSYAMTDIYSLNTKFTQGATPTPSIIMPEYQRTTTTSTSLPAAANTNYSAGDFPSSRNNIDSYDYYYFQSDYDPAESATNSLSVTVYDSTEYRTWSYSKLHSFYYDGSIRAVNILYYDSNKVLLTRQIDVDQSNFTFQFFDNGSYSSTGYLVYSLKGNYTNYVDLSSGFRLTGLLDIPDDTILNDSILYTNAVKLDLPEYPNNVLLTVDLNTISESDYQLIYQLLLYGGIDYYYTLKKTTDGTGIHWELYKGKPLSTMTKITDLYYDSSRLSNTYQIYIGKSSTEYRYVGNWPTVIGPANAYQVYTFDYNGYTISLKDIRFWNNTPVMRVDASEYRAFEYPILEDETYNPGEFKINPKTTISGNVVYGNSLTFGSDTYTVTDGNISLGVHKVPVKGIVFDSIPNGNGSYDNRINGTKVSESANPAAITFNGKWSASISTVAQEQYEYTKTEWIAGGFAWNGMDQSFLMVGLITSLGMFIALGIYARRSRASVWPLMLVCGGAAALFFIML